LGAGLFLSATPDADAQTTAPFEGLAGKWSVEGSIALTNGTTERLRCDATYAVSGGGETLDQTLHCASDSYNFDLRDNFVDNAGQILGSWNEVTKGVTGGISGRASNGVIQANVSGQAFTAAVTVATHGTEQAVKIRAQSGDLSRVTITLHRAR
jgi:hypothetical protein